MGRKKYTQDKFVESAKEVHGNKYDYSKVIYTDMHTKITVICPIHGEFEVLPYVHINKERKSECEKCGFIKAAKSRSIGFNEFKRRSDIAHDGIYKYIKSAYIGTMHKTVIICPVHGKFEQNTMSHLKGVGCKKCSSAARKLAKLKS